MGSVREDWRAVAEDRQQSIHTHIPEKWRLPQALLKTAKPMELPRLSGIMSDWELSVTQSRATDILSALHSRKSKAVDVIRAFCKRAAIAHQATNCLAEILFEEAFAHAAELDEYMEIHGRPKGVLHGIPVSVKEHIHMKGTKATCGLIAWADQMSPKDALIVRTLREQGAVFHVKTTNPQTLMAIETDSNLFGRTLNPHNPELSSGGSTGGEGALIAMGGSVMGIGTDIGGSIRVPSAFCGIHGIKPSVGRLPHGGLSGLHDGMQNIIGAVGPMARSIEDLELFCSVALANQPWDHEPSLIGIPWKTDVEMPTRLKIGVIWNDGVVQPHPPVSRALKEVVTALQNEGYTTVDWNVDLHKALTDTVNEAYFLDGGKEYHDVLSAGREPPVPILRWLLENKANRRYSVEETWRVNAQLDRLRTKYAEQWNDSRVDAIICPVNASVASVHEESRYWGYSSVFNALDYPAVVIPVGIVKQSDTWESFPPASSAKLSEMDDWYHQLYDEKHGPSRYCDAPVGIQIVGRRLQEEKLLKIAERIENSVSRRPRMATSWTRADEIQRRDLMSRPMPEKSTFLNAVSELQEPAAVAA
ncbi:uncharacterized protein Z518_06306 [Rhinocladiella mackenziei CBS 650.93]|uniref:Amidase domain-containing protein n=1 Tax=Rhinocladiella mackenziei CBS 650.93 TaxID=1442369 RepID=A0A0D2II53_9EURO|nr:uncharacterized protein Z518_06306 [Rhinocladiella mackenziei CBS 650.93]KIX05434.1 hypothetical protein Z518_06306 [Rhinocladiella mackenziei CBS 650.93]